MIQEQDNKSNIHQQKSNTLEKNDKNEIKESVSNELEEINIYRQRWHYQIKANEVYLDIYRKAREKAKLTRNEAIKAYLEAKRIKELYMLDVVDSSDDEDIDYNSE